MRNYIKMPSVSKITSLNPNGCYNIFILYSLSLPPSQTPPSLLLPHTPVWSHIPLQSSSGWCVGGGLPPWPRGEVDPCGTESSSYDSGVEGNHPTGCWTRSLNSSVRLEETYTCMSMARKHIHTHKDGYTTTDTKMDTNIHTDTLTITQPYICYISASISGYMFFY